MPTEPESEFRKLMRGILDRTADENGNILPHLVNPNNPEDDHIFCTLIEDAFAHAAQIIFDDLPMPLRVLCQTALHQTYHEFAHLIFEMGRQYEINNTVTTEDVVGISSDDLKGAVS